jgi:DNA-binding beta-propeller fold protein YncE
VGHETETFVSVLDAEGWKPRAPLKVGRAQHDLSISPDGRHLWFTVTNRPYKAGDPRVGVVDLAWGKVTLIDTGANAHDITLGADGRIAWVTNSGFLHLPDSRVDYLDAATWKPLGSLTLGRYPFHGPRRAVPGTLKVAPRPHGLAVVTEP